MSASSRSAAIGELSRMFPNLDLTVIESVLTSNDGQVDMTIDHLLIISIDNENENNIQQLIPTTPLRQLPDITYIYEDDPPPYPGIGITASNRATTTHFLPKRSVINPKQSIPISKNDPLAEHEFQTRGWKTSYGQYRICYSGDLPDDFLRIKSIQNQTKANKEFLRILKSDQSIRSISQHFSTKPLPIPPSVKTPKVHARMLHNILIQIERGQTMKTSMVPEEPITASDGYSYEFDNVLTNKEQISRPAASFIGEYDPLRLENNEEFIARFKNKCKKIYNLFSLTILSNSQR